MINQSHRVFALLGVLATLCLIFACHLGTTPDTQETFNFPTLKEKIGPADQVTIILKDSTGKLVDVLFDGPVSATTSFQELKAPHYDGGKVIIHIEAKLGDQVVYKVERGFHPAQGGDQERIVHLSPSVSVLIQWASPRIREGEYLLLPAIQVQPQEISDKSLFWTSRNPKLLQVTSDSLKGIAPGQVRLVAWLKSDTTKRDSVLVEVIAKSALGKAPDSLRLVPDSMLLALRGPSGQFAVDVYPASASKDIQWSVLGANIVQITPNGNLTPQGEGIARVVATSLVEPAIADTAQIRVVAAMKVDSIRFGKRTSELFVLGAAESLSVWIYPPLAPPGMTLTVRDTGILRLTGRILQGLKEGETWVDAASNEDPSRRDSLAVIVFPTEIVDSVRLREDTLRLYVRGESLPLTPSIFPASLKGRYLWRSENEAVAKVDAEGRVSPVAAGQTQAVLKARADSTKQDHALILVKKDVPRIQVGGDTVIARGITLTHNPVVTQDYGVVTLFKWDLDGDGVFEDSSSSERKGLSYHYGEAKEYRVRFYVRDTEGNDTLHSRLVKAVNGRVVQITSPKDGSFTNKIDIPITWQLDGNPRTDTETLRLGTNLITRSAQDSAGNTYSHSITLTLDQTAPQRPLVKGPAVPVNTLKPRWSWESGDTSGSGTYRYRVDSPDLGTASFTTDTSYAPAENLQAGARILYVQERDEAGNWSESGTFTVTLDTTAPSAPSLQVTPGLPTNNPRPTWNWSGGTGDALRFYRYKLDSDDFRSGAKDTTGTTFQPSTGLSEGVHVLYVQERDSAGNWSATASRSVTLDFTPPATPLFDAAPYSPLNSTRPRWTWRSGGGGAKVFRARVDGADWSGVAERSDSSFTPEAHLIEGRHTVYVQERDAAGNWSEAAEKSTVLALRREVGGLSADGLFDVTSLISSKDGRVFMAYQKDWQNPSAGVKRFNGQVWEQLGDPSTFGKFLWSNSVAVSQSGVPYLALTDSLGRLTVVRYVANQWQPIGPQSFTPGSAGEVAIAISRTDVPFVAFRDGDNGGLATVMRWSGTAWENVGPRGISVGFSTFFSISITASGVPIIFYLDSGQEDADRIAKVVIQKYNASNENWSYVGNFPVRAAGNSPVSLVNTEEDSLFAALSVEESAGAGETYKYNASTWSTVGDPVNNPPETFFKPFLAIVPQGNKYVAYTEFSGERPHGRIKVLRGSSWVELPSVGSDMEVRGITTSPEGVPWILLNYQGTASVWKMSFDP